MESEDRKSLLEEKEYIRFKYIKEHQNSSYIKKACRILKVLRSDYYNYLSHKPSTRDIENRLISEEIQKIFAEHKGRNASIRIAKVLETQGLKVNRTQVSRLMRLMGLCRKGTNYKYKRYNQQNKHEEHLNLLNRIFKAESKNKIWIGDINYIPTKK